MAPSRTARGNAAPSRPPLTHFLCIPLVNESSRAQLTASLQQFREDVSPSRLSPKAIRPLGTLHCTLGVMSLNSQTLNDAVTTLQHLDLTSMMRLASVPDGDSDSETAGSKNDQSRIDINLAGLVSMHDDRNTSILYTAPDDPSGRLLPLCLALKNTFSEKKLLIEEDRELLLHATIVNTVYAKEKRYGRASKFTQTASSTEHSQADQSNGGPAYDDRSAILQGDTGHGKHAKSSMRFDARQLLEDYKQYTWAEHVLIDRIAICKMGAKKTLDNDGRSIDERYEEVAHIMLPT